jgi:hypothetical protein
MRGSGPAVAPYHVGHIAPPPDEQEPLRLTLNTLASTVHPVAQRHLRADGCRCALIRVIGAADAAAQCDMTY